MKKRCMACTVGVMFIVCFSEAFADEGKIPSAAELLDRYAESLDASLSFISDYEDIVKYSYKSVLGQCRGTKYMRGQVRYDGQRIYYQEYNWGDFNSKLMDLPEDKPYYRCTVQNKEMFYQNCTWVNVEDHIGSAKRKPKPKDIDVTLARLEGSSYLAGYIGCDERLDKVLRKADRIQVRNKRDKIGEYDCYVIDAFTQYGRYSVWIAPEHGYLPAKVRLFAKENDLHFSRKLLKGASAKTYLSNARFEKYDGVWIPMQADAGTYYRYSKGNFSKSNHRYKRTGLILNPDHEKLGSFADPILENASNDPELKEGDTVRLTRVNDKTVKFKWQEGGVIPATDKSTDDKTEATSKEDVILGKPVTNQHK